MKQHSLPQEIRTLVRVLSKQFGVSILDIFGQNTFNRVEQFRKQAKKMRELEKENLFKSLRQNLSQFKKLPLKEIERIAHCLAIYIEVINRAEAAYQRYRIQKRKKNLRTYKKPHRIIFVFTAHPTEARSPKSLDLFRALEKEILLLLDEKTDKNFVMDRIAHYFNLLLYSPLAPQDKPRVQDEAFQIYATVLRRNILHEQIELYQKGVTVEFRTWAGGDKDGHPFVDKKVMFDSLQMSRVRLVEYLEEKLKKSRHLIQQTSDSKTNQALITAHNHLLSALEKVRTLGVQDGRRVQLLRTKLHELFKKYKAYWKGLNPFLIHAEALIWLYPALVLPIELREDSAVLCEDASEAKKIREMLACLKEISQGHDPKWYSRGFIMSMVHSADEIQQGIKILEEYFTTAEIPLVPLFETDRALSQSKEILEELFSRVPRLVQSHRKDWHGRFEVMLGYSDSAKESGTLYSRYLISQTLHHLDRFLKSMHLTPVFFHGSGGSIERGGGAVRDQIHWWPKSALNVFKTTIQGEMVTRNFGSSEVMESIVSKVCHEFDHRKTRESPRYPQAFLNFVKRAQEEFQNFIHRDDFIRLINEATPYPYLGDLNIGSRPSSRQKKTQEFKIRAIPWILCWTQTRVLFPTWFGLGSAFHKSSDQEKYELIRLYRRSSFFKNFMYILGFTLAKVELSVFRLYLEENLSKFESEKFYAILEKEFQLVQTCFREITGEEDFLWFKPWLKESIYYRSPLVHILNLIQLVSFERKDTYLLRKTVTGIAAGMMSTG